MSSIVWFDSPERVQPFRPLIAGLALASLVNSVFWIGIRLTTGMHMDISFAFAMSLWTAAFMVRTLAPKQVTEPVGPYADEVKPKKEVKDIYCRDCGKVFEIRQRQEGFSALNGQPKLTFQLGCPDGDPLRPTKAYDQYITGPRLSLGLSPGFQGARYCWPHCGDTVFTTLLPAGHQHAAGVTSTTCPACIQQMLSDKIIDIPTARGLLAERGSVQ